MAKSIKTMIFHNPYIKYAHNYASSGFSFDRALIKQLTCLKNAMGSTIKVLDFGCGMKPFAYLFEDSDEYIGLDVYPGEMVDIVYNGNKLPFPDNYFDVIFSTSVLEHVENLDESLGEISRVLNNAGVFVSVVPFINHVHGSPFDFHRHTRFGWQSMLKKSFVVCEVSQVDNRWQCVLNVLTSAINNTIYGFLRRLRKRLTNPGEEKSLEHGDASPESRKNLSILYLLMKFNPINISLGFIFLLLQIVGRKSSHEGEITSGYLLVASNRLPNSS